MMVAIVAVNMVALHLLLCPPRQKMFQVIATAGLLTLKKEEIFPVKVF